MGVDRLDFSALDANTNSVGTNEAFKWGGDDPTAHGLWFAKTNNGTVIYGDTDGIVETAEFMITLTDVDLTPWADPLTPPSNYLL